MVIKYIVGKITNPFICISLMIGTRSKKFIVGIQNDFS